MADARPTLWELNRYFLMLGATGFGGPVTLANYMRRDLVEALHWLSEEEYDRGLAIATACPGPLAYQLGVYCGYVTHGVPGGILVGLSFALAPFIIVTAAAIVYVHYAATDWIRGLFYGIGPVVVALILKACLNLGTKTLKRETSAWIVAVVAVFITVLVKKELIGLFLAASALGIFIFKPHQKPVKPVDPAPSAASPTACITAAPLFLGLMPAATSPAVLDLFLFFFRTGLLVFGSGLVIVSFVKTYVVDQYHWMNDRAFLDAVAIGLRLARARSDGRRPGSSRLAHCTAARIRLTRSSSPQGHSRSSAGCSRRSHRAHRLSSASPELDGALMATLTATPFSPVAIRPLLFRVSGTAVTELRRRGYDARALAGGISAWHAIGGETVALDMSTYEVQP